MEKNLEGNELLNLKNCMVLWNLSINKSADKACLVWYLKNIIRSWGICSVVV